MAAALARRQIQLCVIGKKQQSNLVAAPSRGNREGGGDLSGELAFASLLRAKSGRGRNIDYQHHGQLALLPEALHERSTHSVRNIPVNIADLISGDVFAQLFKIHAAAFEMA